MQKSHQELWKKISEFELNDPNAQFDFTDRLARENDWTLEYATRAVWEYKRFLFLIMADKKPKTPSDQVDQVWHLHLIYTQSYWIDLCKNTLNTEIHHGPTKGAQERNTFKNLYAETLAAYRDFFEIEPPQDIWPNEDTRFKAIKYTRVNRHTHWVIPKKIIKR